MIATKKNRNEWKSMRDAWKIDLALEVQDSLEIPVIRLRGPKVSVIPRK